MVIYHAKGLTARSQARDLLALAAALLFTIAVVFAIRAVIRRGRSRKSR